MRDQDYDLIKGLKDIISNLTATLKEKESSYRDLQEKYVKMWLYRLSWLIIAPKIYLRDL